jgi:NACalpha-BTF3-like transcription factor
MDDKNSPKLAVFVCACGNAYKYRQGLYKHKKNCSIVQAEYDEKSAIEHYTTVDKTDMTQKLVELIMSKNQEFMTELVTNLTNSNQDVVNKMMDIMPSVGNNFE